MSNALAIATVTQTLVNRVTVALGGSLVSGAHVTAMRPDDALLQGNEATPRVNVFLYQVAPNLAFRNADLPTRRADGTLVQKPQLALDLYYLFTFYGNDANLEHQRLLGAVARYLHAYPTLNRADIHAVELMKDSTNNDVLYLDSKLSEQSELVRFTPVKFTLDDLSKLWAAFPTVDFVLSAVYSASVVLIQTDDVAPGPALPVLVRQVRALPFNLSTITGVTPQPLVLTAAPVTLTLHGQALSLDNQAVFMTPGNTTRIPAAIGTSATPDAVPVTLPAGLRAGINTVQLQQVDLSPPGPTASSLLSTSNAFPFLLSPRIVNLAPVAGGVTVKVDPRVGPDQTVTLMLNQKGGGPAYTLNAPPHPTDTDTLVFSTAYPNPLGGPGATLPVPAGTYLARINVDAAASALDVDASGTFNGPTVTV
jgi:Pvc16 N-terminal domain